MGHLCCFANSSFAFSSPSYRGEPAGLEQKSKIKDIHRADNDDSTYFLLNTIILATSTCLLITAVLLCPVLGTLSQVAKIRYLQTATSSWLCLLWLYPCYSLAGTNPGLSSQYAFVSPLVLNPFWKHCQNCSGLAREGGTLPGVSLNSKTEEDGIWL